MQIFESPQLLKATLGPSIVTIGKYDGMHLGHQQILATLLSRARELHLPAVVILSEPQPEEFFTPETAPVRLNHFQDKVEFLAASGVDAVLCMKFDAQLSAQSAESFVKDFLLQALGMKALVIGDDFRFGAKRTGDYQLLQALSACCDFEVSSVPPCCSEDERVSSTLVRSYLQAGDCNKVAQLLGRPYSISGEVIRGQQLGRQLGVPTANVSLLNNALPVYGVFVVSVELNEEVLQGVANLGYKPTVSTVARPSLEVHLLDFDQDIYGQRIKVGFLHKLRNELKFNGLEALKQQLGQDISQARDFFRQELAGLSVKVGLK